MPLFASLYRRSRTLRRAPCCRGAQAVVLVLALCGCSLSMPLGPLAGGRDHGPETTGSVAPIQPAPSGEVIAAPLPPPGNAAAAPRPLVAASFAPTKPDRGAAFSTADWLYARGALGLALSGDAGGPPVPWANPDTGTHGAFAPSAPAVTDGGTVCRAFVAQRVAAGSEEKLTGRACRSPVGAWDIAEIRKEPAAL